MDGPNNVLPRTIDRDHQPTSHNENTEKCNNQGHYKRNLICFWLIGLCNGFGGTVMWSATFDILHGLNGVSV